MKLDLKYVGAGIIISCIGLTTAFATTKISKINETNLGLIFEGKRANQPHKTLSVQFENDKINYPYINLNTLLELLSLEAEYDKSKNAYVIVNNGWSNKTPVRSYMDSITIRPTLPELEFKNIPSSTDDVPKINEDGFYDFGKNFDNYYSDFMYRYLVYNSFEVYLEGSETSNYSISFYKGNIVRLFRLTPEGSYIVGVGKYDILSNKVTIKWNTRYNLDQNKVVVSMNKSFGEMPIIFNIKANSDDVYLDIDVENFPENEDLHFKKVPLKQYYKTK